MSSSIQIAQGADEFALLVQPPLLITESAEEYAALLAGLQHEIKPKGVVERIYLGELAELVWQLQRLRRCKAAIINSAFRPAMQSLLERLLLGSNTIDDFTSNANAAALTEGWFKSEKGKVRVRELLTKYNLDELRLRLKQLYNRGRTSNCLSSYRCRCAPVSTRCSAESRTIATTLQGECARVHTKFLRTAQ